MNTKIFLLTFMISLVFLSSAHAMIMIDGLSDSPGWDLYPELNQTLPNQTLTRLDTGLADTIGGSRFTSATQVNGDDPMNFQLGVGGGYLGFSLGAGDGYGTTSLLYDRNGQGLGADLSSAQNIDVHFWADHFGCLKPSIMSMTLTDDLNHTFTETKVWPTYMLVQAWRHEYFPLSSFSGVDTSHIWSILFYYEAGWANDLSFDSILANTTVSEPATLSLLGLGLLGLLNIRRKHV